MRLMRVNLNLWGLMCQYKMCVNALDIICIERVRRSLMRMQNRLFLCQEKG